MNGGITGFRRLCIFFSTWKIKLRWNDYLNIPALFMQLTVYNAINSSETGLGYTEYGLLYHLPKYWVQNVMVSSISLLMSFSSVKPVESNLLTSKCREWSRFKSDSAGAGAESIASFPVTFLKR